MWGHLTQERTEVGTDSESNAYHIWTGADQGVYMSQVQIQEIHGKKMYKLVRRV